MSKEFPRLSTRLVQISCAIVWCLVAAGPVFGFAAFKPILISEGVYKEKCGLGTSEYLPCAQQDLSLNFMFTMAAVVTNAAALIVGQVLDRYGPRVSGIIGSIILAFASLTLSSASSMSRFDGYLLGYVLLALGGPFVFISSFQLANSFPKNSGLVLALLTGAFDSSSALFLLYRLVYQQVKKVPIHHFFQYYMVVPVFIFICQLTIMPSSSYKTIGTIAKIGESGLDETGYPVGSEESLHSQSSRRSSTQSNGSYKTIHEEEADSRLAEKSGGVFGALHGKPLRYQMKTPWFVIMALFTTIQMLRINYFVATVRSQEEFLLDPETALQINHFFDIALPVGGLLSIPFIGLVLDNMSTLHTLTMLTAISVLIGILGLLPTQWAAYSGIAMLVVYRPFYYTAVSDFCAKVFGFETFGTVYGAIICFSGFCNLLQSVLDSATHKTFNLNPTPVNGILVLLTLVFGALLIGYVKSQTMETRKIQLVNEAENTDAIEIPV